MKRRNAEWKKCWEKIANRVSSTFLKNFKRSTKMPKKLNCYLFLVMKNTFSTQCCVVSLLLNSQYFICFFFPQSLFYFVYRIEWVSICFCFTINYCDNFWFFFIPQKGSTSNPIQKTIYRKAIKKIDKLSKGVHVILMYFEVPYFVLSNVVISIYKYFLTDYSNEKFHLTYPAT